MSCRFIQKSGDVPNNFASRKAVLQVTLLPTELIEFPV
jgi:hypothetical protein